MRTDALSKTLSMQVAALAAATLMLEGTLLRLLAVTQFYHFAFLVVSLALLGFAASGTLLTLSARLRAADTRRLLAATGLAFAASVTVSYVAVNLLPFDSYGIAWDRRQILYFVLYYVALTLPFFCSGLGIGAALAASQGRSHLTYAANLFGSAAGALLAPAALWLGGVPAALLLSALIGLLAALARPWRAPVTATMALGALALVTLVALNWQARAPLLVTVSPYKGLAHALRYPGARTIFGAWNAIARVDVIADAGTRQLPGLSYAYTGALPAQHGLALDAAALQPVTLTLPHEFAAAQFLPESIAFALRPNANALVLEPGAGLGVLQALAGGAQRVTAVVDNPLMRHAVGQTGGMADAYANLRVTTVHATGRVFSSGDRRTYDVVFLPLTDAYQPVSSGAYSLAESYNLTLEAMVAALERVGPGGVLATSRWLQIPPSESMRMIATLIDALDAHGVSPADALVAFRGIQTMTVLVRPDGWPGTDLAAIRRFLATRKYDVVWAPDVEPGEVNRFNRLAEPIYYEMVRELLHTTDRPALYRAYPFVIEPATDDHPFFYHFFTWRQTPEVLATYGRTWQPFGGSGYLLLLAMLALTVVLSTVLVAAPLALHRSPSTGDAPTSTTARWRTFGYFGLLGLAFLFVEIPLIQRWILLLGHATYAFTAVVLVLLLGSGMGSVLARRTRAVQGRIFGVLVTLALATPFATAWLASLTLGWPSTLRIAVAAVSLAPLAFLMGMPFPWGLAWLEDDAPRLVPWAWAVNGCASVISGVLAAILALSYGFTAVLLLGATCYAGAWLLSRQASQQPA